MAAEMSLPTAKTVRRAWIVLTGAFLCFLLLLTSTMTGAYIYVRSATQERDGRLEAIGDVLLQARNEKSFKQVRTGELVREGDTIKTQRGAQARLAFLDGSVTLHMSEDAIIQVDELRTSRFVGDEKRLRLTQPRGWSRLNALPATDYEIGRYTVVLDGLHVDLETPRNQSAEVLFELRPREWQWRSDQLVASIPLEPLVAVWDGAATVRDGEEAVPLVAGQMLTRLQDGQLSAPLAARREYVRNGLFGEVAAGRDRDRLVARQWRLTAHQGGDGGRLDGTAQLVQREIKDNTVPVVLLKRRLVAKDNAQVGIAQPLDLPLSHLHSLRLRVVFQVNYHSLSGGGAGAVDSEYPLIIKLTYRDADNKPAAWYQGFFLHNAEGWAVPHGQQVRQDQWVVYEVDLLPLKDGQGQLVQPAPIILETLDIYAEGHDFEAQVASVSIEGE